jgi:hypothetical protein
MGMDLQKLKTVQQQVEYILEQYTRARDDDKLLQVLVLKKFYKVVYIDDILRNKVPSLETIRRIRQKLQHEGKYLSSKQIRKLRQEQEEVYRQFAVTKI